MQVNREIFLHSLESVQPGLSPREIVEQSSCFIFQNGEVLSFNDEMACRSPSGLDESFEGAVQADPLLNILRKLPEEEIELEMKEAELIISGKRRKAGIRMEKEISLPINQVEKPGEWTKLHEEFADAINVVKQCAGHDESKFLATCVHLHPKWIEATDDIQICRWRLKTGIKQSTLVRQSSVKHVTALGMVEFSETDAWLHFRNKDGLVLSCRRYVEDFPDLGQFLDVEGTPTLLPKGIIEEAARAEIFSSENTENNQVTVQLKPGLISLKGLGINGWYRWGPRKIKYDGKAFSFFIAPQLLSDLIKRHNEMIIAPDRLKVDGGSYVYISCLFKPPENGEASEENVEEGGES